VTATKKKRNIEMNIGDEKKKFKFEIGRRPMRADDDNEQKKRRAEK